MGAWAQLIAILSAAFFAGGALYITLVEHPARMAAGVDMALAQFRPMYRRAAPWQAVNAAVAGMAGLAASLLTGEPAWALGGIAVWLVIPFTIVSIGPTNKKLLADEPPEAAEAAELLRLWGRLHALRSALGTFGLLVFLVRANPCRAADSRAQDWLPPPPLPGRRKML